MFIVVVKFSNLSLIPLFTLYLCIFGLNVNYCVIRQVFSKDILFFVLFNDMQEFSIYLLIFLSGVKKLSRGEF